MAVAPGLPTWRSLADGLVWRTARAIVLHAVVVTGPVLVGAWALHRAWFAGGSTVLQGVGAVRLVPVFGAGGPERRPAPAGSRKGALPCAW